MLWSCVRVVVLSGRLVERDTVNELISNQTLLLKKYTWMARAVYNVVARTRGRLRLSSARAHGRLQLKIR
jgi:hypothetical protein